MKKPTPLSPPISRFIAVAIYPRWSYDRGVLRGIARFTSTLPDLGHVVLPEHSEVAWRKILDSASSHRIIGVVGSEGPMIDAATRLGLPTVVVTAVARRTCAPRVLTDDLEIGRRVATHFLVRGYRRLGFVDYRRWTLFGRLRYQGFREVAIAGRARVNRFASNPSLIPTLIPGGREVDRYLTAFIRRSAGRPMGIMASTDHLGVDLIAALRRLSVRVPEDVAVVGVDDNDVVFESCSPPLSSMAQRTELIGYHAADRLLALIAGETPVPAVSLIEPGELSIRRSSEPMALSDSLVASAMSLVHGPTNSLPKVETLASDLGVSRKTLDARFKSVLGRTPAAEAKRVQIERTKRLLADTELSMSDIARAAGFSSAQQLSASFQRITGRTPTSYRRATRAVPAPRNPR